MQARVTSFAYIGRKADLLLNFNILSLLDFDGVPLKMEILIIDSLDLVYPKCHPSNIFRNRK